MRVVNLTRNYEYNFEHGNSLYWIWDHKNNFRPGFRLGRKFEKMWIKALARVLGQNVLVLTKENKRVTGCKTNKHTPCLTVSIILHFAITRLTYGRGRLCFISRFVLIKYYFKGVESIFTTWDGGVAYKRRGALNDADQWPLTWDGVKCMNVCNYRYLLFDRN